MKPIAVAAAILVPTVASLHAQFDVVRFNMNGGFYESRVVPFESKIIKGQPYSAEIVSENVQTLADGNRIVQKTTGRVYRDGEGRVRREEDRESRSPSISIMDVVAGQSYSLNVEQRTAQVMPGPLKVSLNAVTTKLTEQLIEQKKRDAAVGGGVTNGGGGRGAFTGAGTVRPATNREETTEDRLQDRLIGGVLATGTRRTTTIAAGAIGNERPITVVSEEWFSSDLQILVQTEHADPRSGRATYQVRNIIRTDPDPSLFQVPADYTIRTIGGGGRRGQQ